MAVSRTSTAGRFEPSHDERSTRFRRRTSRRRSRALLWRTRTSLRRLGPSSVELTSRERADTDSHVTATCSQFGTAVAIAEGAPLPSLVAAVTETEYEVPLVRPRIEQVVAPAVRQLFVNWPAAEADAE